MLWNYGRAGSADHPMIQGLSRFVEKDMNAARTLPMRGRPAVGLSAPRGAAVTSSSAEDSQLDARTLSRLVVVIAADRDRQAFTWLYRHYAPRLKSYFLRSGLAGNVSEELAQETMLQVWRKAALFDPAKAGAGTWIFTIARNLRIDFLRQNRIRPSAGADMLEEADTGADSEALLLIAEREDRLRAALKTLSCEQETIVRLSFFSDKPHMQIAQELGIPLGTVKSRVRLALAKLRGLLDCET